MNRQELHPADRDEWLTLRTPYFNASAAGIIDDSHPFLTQGAYAVQKLSGKEPDETRAMKRGTMLEGAIARWWEEESGHTIVPPGCVFVCDRIMATPDFLLSDDPFGLLEVKSTIHRWSELPKHVWWQVQAQLGCSGKLVGWVAALDCEDLKEFRVDFDPAAFSQLAAFADRFMSFIDLGMLPEGVELSYEEQTEFTPVAEVAKKELVVPEADVVEEWRMARDRRLAAEKEENALKGRVAEILGNAGEAWFDGMLLATWRNDRPAERVDWKLLEAENPELVALYRREVPGARKLLPAKHAQGA